jgi:hypothetical protein
MKISKKSLSILIENFLKEEENEEKEISETDSFALPDEFSFFVKSPKGSFEVSSKRVNNKIELTVSHNDEVMSFQPKHVIAIAFFKMRELLGEESDANKKLFNQIGAFIKEIDANSKADDAMSVYKEKKNQYIRFIKQPLDDIKKIIDK